MQSEQKWDGTKSRCSPWNLRSTVVNRGHGIDDVALHGTPHYTPPKEVPRTQTAEEIFCSSNSDPTRRTGIIEGKRVTFELMENVTQSRGRYVAATSREERQRIRSSIKNARPSHWDRRVRWWLMHFRVTELTVMYVAAFVAMNYVFVGFWSIQGGKCCGDDPEMSVLDLFDFAIQTSTTIGYGGYVPDGRFANFLVFAISILTLILNSVYAGLLFMKFVAPAAKIRFSEIMTLSNLNGVPCLELRLGNEDGRNNMLLDATVRMTYTWALKYVDERGNNRQANQTEELKLLCVKKPALHDFPWTLRHRVDEKSQLFGLDLFTSQMMDIEVTLEAIQKVSGARVFAHATYTVEDIMIGHRFVDQIEYNKETRMGSCDYAKFDETVPEHVWYPVKPDQAAENEEDAERDDRIHSDDREMFYPEDQTSKKEKSPILEEGLLAPLVETHNENLARKRAFETKTGQQPNYYA